MNDDSIEVLRELVNKWRELASMFDNLRQRGAMLGCARELSATLAFLSSPKPSGEWVLVPRETTLAMREAAERVEEDGYDAMHKAMLAAAPKPESAEAVAWVSSHDVMFTDAGNWRYTNPVLCSAQESPDMIPLYTAPPRPEVSAPDTSVVGVESEKVQKAINTITWIKQNHGWISNECFETLCRALRQADLAQQAAADPLVEWANSPLNFTATVGVFKDVVFKDGVQPAADATSVAVDEAMERDAHYWRTLITECKRDHIWYHVLPPDLTGKHDSIEAVLDALAGQQGDES